VPAAFPALFYLCWRSGMNAAGGRLRRLKQPKYLFGGILGAAYLYMVFMLPYFARAQRREEQLASGITPGPPLDLVVYIDAGAAVALFVMLTVLWLWRRPRASLQFSEAEIAFLFPAPLSHSALVHFSLIRIQLIAAGSAVLLTLITAGYSFVPSPLWARFFGWWLIFGVFTLHVAASGFVFTRLLNKGLAQWQRQLGVAVLLALVFLLIALLDPNLH
jgi:ABC-2 type transport system permease protein